MTGLNGLDNRLLGLFDGGAVFWLLLLVAFGVGAAHAVAPGHGKTVTAAYLVGTHGRYRGAARLGVIVAVMHTFSVLVLVLALVWAGLSMSATTGRSLDALILVVAFGVGWR